ncbi:MAG: DEAD/DEAH box helicase [Deltaproteobacteria bacterium]|nr:DEAD/DEAH box helicase [Deltaproteobacteria bacterium]
MNQAGGFDQAEPIRRRLPRTAGVFFGRFSALTPIQASGVSPILEGRDVLLTAPTAGGKTEAYVAPIVERLLGSDRGRVHAIIVSPTRALANDLRRRLDTRLEDLGVSFGRYTGEHKELLSRRLPELVITTPEALDSLLARRPEALKTVAAVVIDEIHVLDGTARGDQLRVLLHRLELAASHRPQRVAASATVSSPEELAARYLRDAVLVSVEGKRPIHAKEFEGGAPEQLVEHVDTLAAVGLRKILIFANRRVDVEEISAHLRGRTRFGDSVFPHHGSLSQPIRERTEQQFLDAPSAVAVATMTLELGIDIGTVDYVLLLGPPPSVSSLLQRIGRGNRRTGKSRVGCVIDDSADAAWFRVLLGCAAAGDLCPNPYAFRPGVLIQQALVSAGVGHVTLARLREATPPSVRESYPAEEILDAAVGATLLEPPASGRFVLSEREERRYNRGLLHGNIDAEAGFEVVDRITGETVGRMLPDQSADSLQLGARGRREIARIDDRVLTDVVSSAGPARFASRPRGAVSFRLARKLAESLGVTELEIPQLRSGEGVLLLHGLGTVGGLLLAEPLRGKRGPGVIRVSAAILLLREPIDRLPTPDAEAQALFIASKEKKLARVLAMGPYHQHLPRELAHRALADAAGLAQSAEFLARAHLRTEDREAPDFWRRL